MYPTTEEEYDKMEGNCFSQGVVDDGLAILLNGKPMDVETVIRLLNDYFKLINCMNTSEELIRQMLTRRKCLDPKIADIVSDNFEELAK